MSARLTLNGIKRSRLGKDGPSFRRFCNSFVVIWSGEHRLYWRSNGAGYTAEPTEAGVYHFPDAYSRTWHCGPEKKIEYRKVKS